MSLEVLSVAARDEEESYDFNADVNRKKHEASHTCHTDGACIRALEPYKLPDEQCGSDWARNDTIINQH